MKDGQNISLEELVGKSDEVKILTVGDKEAPKSKIVRGLVLAAMFSLGVVTSPFIASQAQQGFNAVQSNITSGIDYASTVTDKALLKTRDLIDDHLKSSSDQSLITKSKVDINQASKGFSINPRAMKVNYTASSSSSNNAIFSERGKLTQEGVKLFAESADEIKKIQDLSHSVKLNINQLKKEADNGDEYAKSQLSHAKELVASFMSDSYERTIDQAYENSPKDKQTASILIKDYYKGISTRLEVLDGNLADIVQDVKSEAMLEPGEYDDIFSPGV